MPVDPAFAVFSGILAENKGMSLATPRLSCRWLVLAVVLAPGVARAVGEPPPGPSRRAMAEGYLRRAREYGKASCELAKQHDCHAVEGFYASCEAAWDAVWTCPEDGEVLAQAAEEYAASLEGLLDEGAKFGRYDRRQGLVVGPPQKPIVVPIVARCLPVGGADICKVVAVPPKGDKRVSRCHLRPGFGLPVAVRLTRACGGEADAFEPKRQSLAATAVLRFDLPPEKPRMLTAVPGPLSLDPAPAVLDLVNPVEVAAVNIGAAKPPLAADLTSPLLDMLEAMPSEGIAGFVTPFTGRDRRPQLQFLEPYQAGKIPIVFIHGLASDEGTWFDLLNELRTCPTFHRRYQPWVFQYPTGSAFLRVSLALRRQLAQAVATLDPEGRDPALQRMVLVGHSMGGLHAKLQVVRSGDAFWSAVAYKPIETVRLPDEMRRDFVEQFYFGPQPFVRRVIYIATPHGGSSLASRAVGRVASMVVRQPPQATALHRMIIEANPGVATPEFEQRIPTTVDVLEPSSPLLAALRSLSPSCTVTTHSIIGDVHHSPLGGRDDCIVPVESAREGGVASEVFVPASHTKVHHHPKTVVEVTRILVEHASLGP